jgi:hypothetical protein
MARTFLFAVPVRAGPDQVRRHARVLRHQHQELVYGAPALLALVRPLVVVELLHCYMEYLPVDLEDLEGFFCQLGLWG